MGNYYRQPWTPPAKEPEREKPTKEEDRQNLAEASAIIAPIQNRAIHRAIYARAALGETKAAPEQEQASDWP